MFYAAFTDEYNYTHSNLYYSYEVYYRDTFSPGTRIKGILPFEVKGKTYAEKKQAARDLAISFDHLVEPGLSWGEWADISGYFEKVGRRYGLLREFAENGII